MKKIHAKQYDIKIKCVDEYGRHQLGNSIFGHCAKPKINSLEKAFCKKPLPVDDTCIFAIDVRITDSGVKDIDNGGRRENYCCSRNTVTNRVDISIYLNDQGCMCDHKDCHYNIAFGKCKNKYLVDTIGRYLLADVYAKKK